MGEQNRLAVLGCIGKERTRRARCARVWLRLLAASVWLAAMWGCAPTEPTGAGENLTAIVPRILWKKAGTAAYPDEVDSVRIRVSSSDLASSLDTTVPFSANKARFDGLPSGITITITVQGLDSAGEVAYEGVVGPMEIGGKTAVIDIEAEQVTPLAPGEMAVGTVSRTKVTLSWEDRSGNDSLFVVQRARDGGPYVSLDSVAGGAVGTTVTYTDSGLTPGSTYAYRVYAFNAAGGSADTVTLEVTTAAAGDNTAPAFTTTAADLPGTAYSRGEYSCRVEAADEDNDSVIYSAGVPLEVDAAGFVSWTPAAGDTGEHAVWVKACDTAGSCDSIGWSITVLDTAAMDTTTPDTTDDSTTTPDTTGDTTSTPSANAAPRFTHDSTALSDSAVVGVEYADTLYAVDDDGDPLAFSFIDSAPGMTLTDSIISWTPAEEDTGETWVSVMVIDTADSADTLGWWICVTAPDTGTGPGPDPADTTAPEIAITSHEFTDDTLLYAYGTASSIAGTVSDDSPIEEVTFALNGEPKSVSGTESWSVSFLSFHYFANEIIVTATDTAGNTAADTVWLYYGMSLANPSTPFAIDTTATTARIGWDGKPAADHHVVFRSTEQHGTYDSIAVTADTFYVDSGLTPATDYYYKVEWRNLVTGSGQGYALKMTTAGPATDGLTAYYPFEGSAADESGNGRDGIVHGVTPTEDRFGAAGGAYLFDGADDYINLGATILIGEEMTLACWVRLSSGGPSASQPVLSGRQQTADKSLTLSVTPSAAGDSGSAVLRVDADQFAADEASVAGEPTSFAGRWVFVAAVKSQDTYRLYVDGALDSTRTISHAGAWSTSDLHVGRHGATDSYLAGALDDIRIYDRALPAAEIEALFLEGGWTPE